MNHINLAALAVLAFTILLAMFKGWPTGVAVIGVAFIMVLVVTLREVDRGGGGP